MFTFDNHLIFCHPISAGPKLVAQLDHTVTDPSETRTIMSMNSAETKINKFR